MAQLSGKLFSNTTLAPYPTIWWRGRVYVSVLVLAWLGNSKFVVMVCCVLPMFSVALEMPRISIIVPRPK